MKNLYIYGFLVLFLFNFNCYAIEKGKRNSYKLSKDSVVMYFVRHGKTIFNTTDRVQGWADSPLTPDGVAVAEDLGRGLKDVSFVSVYTSDAGRQRETAKLVMKFTKGENTPWVETTDLRELYFGSFEGDLGKNMFGALINSLGLKTGENPQQKFKDMSIQQMADGLALADPKKEAENWQAFETRVKRALETITKEVSAKGGGNALIVTSGLTISALLFIIDPSQKRLGAENASVSKVIYKDGKYTVESFNDMKFAEQGKTMR